jgi:hypothetical protein
MKLTTHLHLVPRSTRGDLPPLSNTSSCRGAYLSRGTLPLPLYAELAKVWNQSNSNKENDIFKVGNDDGIMEERNGERGTTEEINEGWLDVKEQSEVRKKHIYILINFDVRNTEILHFVEKYERGECWKVRTVHFYAARCEPEVL